MKNVIIISLISLMVISCGGPIYQPGDLAKKENLDVLVTLPNQGEVKDTFWKVGEKIHLYHFSDGEGLPILMVHGGPGYPFSDPWKGLQLLSSQYEFIYYHHRGCGKSSRPIDRFESKNYYQNMTKLEETLGMGAQLMDMEKIRQLLVQDKLVMIGHSFGAFMAILYAIEFPERVKGLILISPAGLLKFPSESGGIYEEVGRLLPSGMKEAYDNWKNEYFDYKNIFKKSEGELMELNAEFLPYYELAMKKKGLSLPEGILPQEIGGWMPHALNFSMGKKHDYTSALMSIQVPVLILHGEQDLGQLEESQQYADLVSGAELIVVKDASHFMFNEQPEEFSRIVGEFLDNLDH